MPYRLSVSLRKRLLQLAIALGLLAGLEGAARLVPISDDPSRLFSLYGANGYERINQLPDATAFLTSAHQLLESDTALMWRLRPGMTMDAATLSLGSAKDWHIEIGPDARRLPTATESRVVALGDSCTFGWGVEGVESWPARLSAVNLGVPGYSSVQGATVAQRDLPGLGPSVVIAAFGANDGHAVTVEDAARLAGRQTTVGRLRYQVAQLQIVTRIRAARFPRWAVGQVSAWKSGEATVRVTPQRYRQALDDIRAQAERMVLLDVCARDEYRVVMADLAGAPGVDLVRYADLGGETLDGCHPTPEGHRRIAEALQAML
ncbi:MAG: lysophospholipase L1-like esterase [Myxococcota bacterium]|jgi:lysophospholipase L1-like esterase